MSSALALASSVVCAAGSATAPANPYIDKGACPFECCTYCDWKTTKPIVLLNKPDGKKKIAAVAAGQVVHAITGDVYSIPVRAVAKKHFADSPIVKGNVFYVLHYAGEGFTAVWYAGKTYDVELEPVGATAEGAPADASRWWVKIRTTAGKTGWVLNNDQFENQDACG